MKLSIKSLLAIAAGLGFAGTDPALAKAHIVEKAKSVSYKGAAIDPATLEWEEEAATKTVEITDDMVSKGAKPETPADADLRLKSAIESVMKGNGTLEVKGRPNQAAPTEIKVRSPGERVFDCMKASGEKTFFPTFDDTYQMQLWLQRKILLAKAEFAGAAVVEKKYREVSDRLSQKAGYLTGVGTADTTHGDLTIPIGFDANLIKNVLEYGVARRIAQMTLMNQETVRVPARTAGISGSYPVENVAATVSAGTYNSITLTAHTFVVLTQCSNQILQDSGINFVDEMMQELALAIATQEDNAYFIGDGSATYAGMVGWTSRMGTTTTDGGQVVIGGSSVQAHTHAQLISAIARVPQYARRGMIFTCSPTVKALLFDRLATSTNTGGLTLDEVTGFGLVSKYLGIPIIENNSMSVTDAAANGTIDVLLGDFKRGSRFGSRLDAELDTDASLGFSSYSTYFRGVVRHDVNCHNYGPTGPATSGAGGLVGPVVAFCQS